MAITSVEDAHWKDFKITSPSYISSTDTDLVFLSRTISTMHETVPIDTVTVKAQNEPIEYEIKLVDGRKWKQSFYDRSINPYMSFDINDVWLLSEFQPHRPVRDAVIKLLVNHNVTNITVRPR